MHVTVLTQRYLITDAITCHVCIIVYNEFAATALEHYIVLCRRPQGGNRRRCSRMHTINPSAVDSVKLQWAVIALYRRALNRDHRGI